MQALSGKALERKGRGDANGVSVVQINGIGEANESLRQVNAGTFVGAARKYLRGYTPSER